MTTEISEDLGIRLDEYVAQRKETLKVVQLEGLPQDLSEAIRIVSDPLTIFGQYSDARSSELLLASFACTAPLVVPDLARLPFVVARRSDFCQYRSNVKDFESLISLHD